jgi:hypothetical protein
VTSSANKTNTFAPDAALTERADNNNSGAGSSPWESAETADSNGVVTAGNHQYTAVVSSGGTSTHKFGAIVYIAPAAVAAVVMPNNNINLRQAVTRAATW